MTYVKEDEIHRLISFFIQKDTFRKLLEERVKGKVPRSYSYPRLVKWALDKLGEDELSKVMPFGSFEEFAESIKHFARCTPISLLRKDDLAVVIEYLSKGGIKWDYDFTTKKGMLQSLGLSILFGGVKSGEVEKAYLSALKNNNIQSIIYNEGYVFGPLGILESNRTVSLDLEELDRLIINLIVPGSVESSENEILWILVESSIKDQHLIQKALNSNQKNAALKQLMISFCSPKEVIACINQTLNVGRLECRPEFFYETAWISDEAEYGFQDVVMTAYGYIILDEQEDEPPEKLANIIAKAYPSEVTLAPDLADFAGTYQLKVLNLCLKNPPDEIVMDYFPLPALRQSAATVGFVNTKRLDKSTLVKLFLLGLGYQLPPEPRWLKTVRVELTDNLVRLRSGGISADEHIGMATSAFRKAERILANLSRFFVTIIENLHAFDDYKEIVEEWVKRPMTRFGISEWVQVLRKLNNKIIKNKELGQKWNQIVVENEAIPNDLLDDLMQLNRMRRPFTHHKSEPATQKKTENALEYMAAIVDKLLSLTQIPVMIRILQEVTNEFGISYIEVLDEEGTQITVYTDEYHSAKILYLMHGETTPVVVKPLLVSLSRSDYIW